MKKNLLLGLLSMMGVIASAQETFVGQPTNDTWVRSNNLTYKGTSSNMEMKSYDDGSGNVQNFYALMGFEFTSPAEGRQVKSAVLRLTTRVSRGDRNINVYALSSSIDEGSTTYATIGSEIEAAIAGEPLLTLSLKGQNNKALTDGGLTDEFLTIAAWQNTIDLTEYVKKLTGNTFTLLFEKSSNNNNTSIIYSKEATGLAWNASGDAIADADVVPQLTVEYEDAEEAPIEEPAGEEVTKTTTAVADTWVRANNTSYKGGTSGTVEIKNYGTGGAESFYALMSFAFEPAAEGEEIAKATLRLVTRYKKGDDGVNIFPIDVTIDEGNTTYATVGSDIEAAIAGEPLATIKLKGDRANSPTDNIAEGYNTVDAWTNLVDVTDYVKSLTGNQFTILLAKVMSQNNSSQIYAKETGDVTLKDNTVFAAKDLVPQLTVTYKSIATTSISNVNAAVKSDFVYTLGGQRVAQPTKGIYVVNGKKVVMK